MHRCILFMTERLDIMPDKLSKNILSPHLETHKYIATKMGENTSGAQLYHHAKFHAD